MLFQPGPRTRRIKSRHLQSRQPPPLRLGWQTRRMMMTLRFTLQLSAKGSRAF